MDNNIIVLGTSIEEHITTLRLIFQYLREHRLKGQQDKMESERDSKISYS